AEPLELLARAQLTLLDVGPAGECPPIADDDGDMGFGIQVEAMQRVVERQHHLVGEGVELRRPVQPQRRDSVGALILHQFRHAILPGWPAPLPSPGAASANEPRAFMPRLAARRLGSTLPDETLRRAVGSGKQRNLVLDPPDSGHTLGGCAERPSLGVGMHHTPEMGDAILDDDIDGGAGGPAVALELFLYPGPKALIVGGDDVLPARP